MSVAATKSTTTSSLFRGPELSNVSFASKTEEMCGDVILEGPDRLKRYVHLKVYRTSLEHFAVVYPLKRLSKPMGIINIRNTCITPMTPPSPTPLPSSSLSSSSSSTSQSYSFSNSTGLILSASSSSNSPNAKTGFTINQRMFDVNTSVTLVCEASALSAWVNAFTSRSSPTLIHQTSLPCVQEEDTD